MKVKSLKQARDAISKMISDRDESVRMLEDGIKEAHWYTQGLKDALKTLEEEVGSD